MTRGYARKLNRVREGVVVVQKAWPIEEIVLRAGLQRLVHLYGHFMTILATSSSDLTAHFEPEALTGASR